jgi:hypothetical protein
MDIVENIKYPTTDSEWIKKVLIGGILLLIPILNFVCTGYYLKVIKGSIEGRNNMPEWDDWGDLFIKGISVLIISLAYLIIPIILISIIILIVSSSGLLLAGIFESASMGVVTLLFILIGSLIGFITLFIVNLMFPMSLAMFANEWSFGDAFKIREIISRIKSVFVEYVIAIIVINILLLLVFIVAWIPFIGWAALFYAMVVTGKIYGKAFANSTA